MFKVEKLNTKQNTIVNEFLNLLPDNEVLLYYAIIEYLVILGYIPYKQKVQAFDLSFKHIDNKKVIAKIGIKDQKCNFRLKFFACKNVPYKFINALYLEAIEMENRYSLEVPYPNDISNPLYGLMKKCTLLCSICTGGGMRYYCQIPDGKIIFRCSAYPVFIPNIEQSDLNDLKRLIQEQHNYFIALRS